MSRYVRIGMIFLLSAAIILSCSVLGPRMTDPATYSHTIEVLNRNRTTVLCLSAASATASAAVSALPTDLCSPLADELSEFSTWFLLILCVVFLEKYLLTIFGFAACYLLIPIGCALLLVQCFFPALRLLRAIGWKLVVLAVALLLVIPTSTWVSDQINAVYSQSIEITVQSAEAVSENLTGETAAGDEESSSVIDEAKTILGDLSGSVAGVIEQFKDILNRFVEATAVMIVTNCLIPVIVVVFFGWIVKLLFNVQIIIPDKLVPPPLRKPRHQPDHDPEDMPPEGILAMVREAMD